MKTSYTHEEGIFTIKVNGRVDSSEAAKFQQEVKAAIDKQSEKINELIIDAKEMEYISSLGLRIFLLLRQTYESMRVVNCSPEIFNVFKMTGFNHMIKVEQTIASISLKGLKPVKDLQDVYQLNDETMLKVFPEGTNKADVDNVVKVSKEAFRLGVATPMTFDIVEVGEGFGLIYEKVIPEAIDATTLGDVLRELHEHIIEPDGVMPSIAQRQKEQIKSLVPYLGEDAVAKLLQMFSSLPDGSCLLHGNLTLDKVFTQGGLPIIIEMGEAGYGNAILDLAHLYATLPEDKKTDFFDDLLRSYYDMESAATLERNERNIKIFSIISRFTESLCIGEPSEETISACREDFELHIASRWDELLSKLHFKIDFNEEIRKLERNRFYTNGDVSIDWLADTLGTNRHYVSDYFNKVLHMTFNEYLNTLRLNYAAELIKAGKIPQSQISYSAGFNNDHTFRRLFKQKYGCTPAQYKG